MTGIEVWPVVAGCSLALAVLLGGGGTSRRHSSPISPDSFPAVPGVALGGLVVGGIGWWAWPIPGTSVALAVILSCAALPFAALVRRQRRAKAAVVVAERVAETAEVLAAELGVGLPPGHALSNACESWPVLAPVVEAERLGADVPNAWRELSALDGAHQLRQVAAAWEVASRTGGGLAVALMRVAEGVRADRITARTVGAELASARATARLVAGLPVAALVMGTSEDSQPIAFLLTEAVGLVCLAGGLALALLGLWWIETIAAGVER